MDISTEREGTVRYESDVIYAATSPRVQTQGSSPKCSRRAKQYSLQCYGSDMRSGSRSAHQRRAHPSPTSRHLHNARRREDWHGLIHVCITAAEFSVSTVRRSMQRGKIYPTGRSCARPGWSFLHFLQCSVALDMECETIGTAALILLRCSSILHYSLLLLVGCLRRGWLRV